MSYAWQPIDFRQPIERLLYKGVSIWDAISSQVIDLTYTDHLADKADEIQLRLRNDHFKWFDQWFPEHGDEMRGFLGYRGGKLLDMGTFFLDEPNPSGSRGGDVFAIRGQSKPVDKALKTKKTRAYEQQSLKQIAQKICSENGLSLVGTPPDVTFARQSQRRENDLEFLARLASDYGAYFNIKGRTATFIDRDELHRQAPVLTLRRGSRMIVDYNLKRASAKTYSKAKATHFDGNTKKTIEVEVEDKEVKTGDTLRIDDRVENHGQAQKLAKSKLQKANAKQWSGTFQIVGEPAAQAGMIVALEGYGHWDRHYIIESARHHDSRSSYTTSLAISDARPAA